MILNMKEFPYVDDATLGAAVQAWFDQLRAAGRPVRDFRLNFITTTRVLVTATYGFTLAGAGPAFAEAPPDG